MRNADYDMDDETGQQPHYTQGMTKGLYAYLYVNGDEHNRPKKVLVNPKRDRNYNAFLDYATKVLNPRYGAVRKIYTPEGRHRIDTFEGFQPDGCYVACGGERYKRLDRPYTQIENSSPRRKHHRNNPFDKPVPVQHSKLYAGVQGKVNTVPIQGKIIKVCRCGHEKEGADVVVLDPHIVHSMYLIKKEIHNKVAAKHDFICAELRDPDGILIESPDEIKSDCLYVAIDRRRGFKKANYRPDGMKPIIVPLSPRDKFQTKYLWKERSHYGGPGDFRRPRTLPPIQSKKHSPDHSVSSYPETRKRNQVNGVPMKPAKHTKRTQRQADYDKDDGGVFRAKGQNRDTRGAREVRDTGDTKVDLPIDQVRAEEVKEERVKKEKQGKEK